MSLPPMLGSYSWPAVNRGGITVRGYSISHIVKQEFKNTGTIVIMITSRFIFIMSMSQRDSNLGHKQPHSLPEFGISVSQTTRPPRPVAKICIILKILIFCQALGSEQTRVATLLQNSCFCLRSDFLFPVANFSDKIASWKILPKIKVKVVEVFNV